MTGAIPKRPSGSSPPAIFFQWVWDSLVIHNRPGRVRGAKVSVTTGGVFSEPLDTGGISGTSSSRIQQYILTSASHGDYFVCRTLGQRTEGEGEEAVTLPAIGATDVFIAKPFHLRQSVFNREVLNEANPSLVGTVDEITYDIAVESLVGEDFISETRKFSFQYFSSTFRIATDETEVDPEDWTSQNQTVIPRLVPAVLIEPEEDDGEITTETISPTIIYAVRCSGLGITRPDGDDAVAVNLLALSDGWAWARTT